MNLQKKILIGGSIITVIYLFTGEEYKAVLSSVIMCILMYMTRGKQVEQKEEFPESYDDTVTYIQKLLKTPVIVKRSKREKRGAIGGFAITIFPAFVYASEVAELPRKDNMESIIHEHVHIMWLVYGFQFPVLIMIFALLDKWWQFIPAVFCFLMLQEMITYEYTKKIAKEHKMEFRGFNLNVVLKYVYYYPSYILWCAGISPAAAFGFGWIVTSIFPSVLNYPIVVLIFFVITSIAFVVLGLFSQLRIAKKVFGIINKFFNKDNPRFLGK